MVIRGQAIRRPGPLIFVEFPAVTAIDVPFDAVAREMQRLLGCESLVVRRNSLGRFGSAAEVAIFPFRNFIELRNPLRKPFVDRCSWQPRQNCHAVQHGKMRYLVGISTSIHQPDHPAHRMPDNCCLVN